MNRLLLPATLAGILLCNGAFAQNSCEPVGDITPICGLQAPEDLVLAPGGRYILFSQMAEGASLGILDTRDDSVTLLMPGEGMQTAGAGEWGSTSCPGSVAGGMLLHGLDLSRRKDGRWQLLATNHGGRESVEFFEVLPQPDAAPEVRWRGCAVTPELGNINDVVALPDGGFLTTQMFDPADGFWGALKSLLGIDTGFVWRWQAETGYEPVYGTEAPFPNGIAMSPDGQHFFVNLYGAGEVRKYRLSDASEIGRVEVSNPDNLAWTQDGRLLVASHRIGFTNFLDAMPPDDGGPADLRFAVIELDPETLEQRILIELEGPPMGAGTVALQVGNFLYIGSYAGDRMIKLPLTLLPW